MNVLTYESSVTAIVKKGNQTSPIVYINTYHFASCLSRVANGKNSRGFEVVPEVHRYSPKVGGSPTLARGHM